MDLRAVRCPPAKGGDSRAEANHREAADARGDECPSREATARPRLPGLRRSDCRSWRERLVLTQDRGLEVAQLLAGLETEILLEPPATSLVRVQRIHLPP